MCMCAGGGDTFSLSSRLMARARASCSSSSPLVVGRACSRSGANRGEEEEAAATEEGADGIGCLATGRWCENVDRHID